mmetsp:Transcript_48968/g.141903  ORF Transcript_48968/g.141903 Transcript_48968/m.141903 type:complete len:386 (-) Transcript_48968:699-1856(-)
MAGEQDTGLLEALQQGCRMSCFGREFEVQLRNRPSSSLTGVLQGGQDAEPLLPCCIWSTRAMARPKREVLEGCVAQTVAKREGVLEAFVAVAGSHALGVADRQRAAGRYRVCLGVGERDGQTARRRVVPEDDVRPRGAGLLAAEEEDEDGGDGVPPGHQDGPGGLHQDDRPARPRGDRGDEVVRAVVEAEARPVLGLAARRAQDDERHVGPAGGRHASGDVVAGRGGHLHARQRRAPGDAPQRGHEPARHHVAAAATGVVVAPGPAVRALVLAVGVVGLGGGGGADDGDAADGAREGQHAAVVLQEGDGLCGEAPCELRVRGARHVAQQLLAAVRGAAARGAGEVHAVHDRQDPGRRLVDGSARLRLEALRVEVDRPLSARHLLV